jgi:hypothetical protein
VVPVQSPAQQTPPLPSAFVSQLSEAHCTAAVQGWPLARLARQVPPSHHRPVSHAASLGQGPQLVALSQ